MDLSDGIPLTLDIEKKSLNNLVIALVIAGVVVAFANGLFKKLLNA